MVRSSRVEPRTALLGRRRHSLRARPQSGGPPTGSAAPTHPVAGSQARRCRATGVSPTGRRWYAARQSISSVKGGCRMDEKIAPYQVLRRSKQDEIARRVQIHQSKISRASARMKAAKPAVPSPLAMLAHGDGTGSRRFQLNLPASPRQGW